MYLEDKKTPWITEVVDDGLDMDLDLEDGLLDPYLELLIRFLMV